MFTGIITDLGRVRAIRPGGDPIFVFSTGYPMAAVAIGASIACSGVCLTVIDRGEDEGHVGDAARNWFSATVSAETLARTTLGRWRPGTPVNFERAMRAGDEFGGHIVLGHADGVARVLDRRTEGESLRFRIEAPTAFASAVAPKGSVALNGVSLTVNEVEGAVFGVNIIPHTQISTSFGTLDIGDLVNFEIDPLARYVARLLQSGPVQLGAAGSV